MAATNPTLYKMCGIARCGGATIVGPRERGKGCKTSARIPVMTNEMIEMEPRKNRSDNRI